MDYRIGSVSLDQIKTNDRTFSITTNRDETDLALSISAVGLLQPPTLLQTGYGLLVVCGFRRIAACKALNLADTPARILPLDCSKIRCAQMAIADNSLQRPLNIVEQSRAYALVRRFADRSSAWQKIAESTGLTFSRTAMDRMLPVADMPPFLQEALLEGSIALPIALQINQLNVKDAMALSVFFRQLTTGLNVQRELVGLISDICLRDDASIAQLIKQEGIAAVIDDENCPAPQKVRQLRAMLKAQRYPELSRAETIYHQKLKSLKLNPRVQIQPPRFFEGHTYRLTLSVDSRRQLKSLQTDLKKLSGHPDLLPE